MHGIQLILPTLFISIHVFCHPDKLSNNDTTLSIVGHAKHSFPLRFRFKPHHCFKIVTSFSQVCNV